MCNPNRQKDCHTVPWAHISLPLNDISIGSSVSAWLTGVPNTQTDRQTQTMESANCVAMLHLCDMQCSELGITSCYSTGSQTPHRCCHPANNVEHVKYVDHLHVWVCPTTGMSSSAPSPEGSGLSPNTWFVGPT